MAVSMAISFWAGLKFKSFWPKVVFFLIATVIGSILYPLLTAGWFGFKLTPTDPQYLAMRAQMIPAFVGVVVMAYFGAWRLPKKLAERQKRNSA